MFFVKIFSLVLLIAATHSQLFIAPDPGHCVAPFGDDCLGCAHGFKLVAGKCELVQLVQEQCGDNCQKVFLQEAINSNDLIPTGNTKLDGNNIYYIQDGTFYVAVAYPQSQARIIASIQLGDPFYYFDNKNFYFTNRNLAVISQIYEEGVYYTVIKVYDFRDKLSIKELYKYQIHGQYVSSDVSQGYFRVVAQGKHSDPISYPFWYETDTQRKDVGRENFHNYRQKDSSFMQGLDGRSTVICSFHLNNPTPDNTRVAVFHRDQPMGIDVKQLYPYKYSFTDNAVYLPTPTQDGNTVFRMVIFDGIQILPNNNRGFTLGQPFAKQFMFVNERKDQLIIGTNQKSASNVILMDLNLKTIIGSGYSGNIESMKHQGNRVFWMSSDLNRQYLRMANTNTTQGSQWDYRTGAVPDGTSKFFDIYQNDRLILYKRVKNINGDTGTRISLVDIKEAYWKFYNEYFFGNMLGPNLNRRGQIFYKSGNLLSIPADYWQQPQATNGAIYLHVSRDKIQFREYKCLKNCQGDQGNFQIDKTVRIEDTIYHRELCGLISIKNLNLEQGRRVYNECGFGPF